MGFDDTDSTEGMCTTFLATEFIREFRDYDLLTLPKLVRLNPNVPWKTRGNAAVCLRFGRGAGHPSVAGSIEGEDVLIYRKGTPATPSEDVFERARRLIDRWAVFDDPKTNPGLAISTGKMPADLYWKAVRGVVELGPHLEAADPQFSHGWKNGRGLIGAVSAMAWKPRDRTYELIAYREPARWGTPREVDAASVIRMDRKFTGTFNNYDYELEHVAFSPASPCPVLYGIRGDDSDYLPDAMRAVESESVDRWLIFRTNQGTDDHVIGGQVSGLEPFTTVRVRGDVAGMPRMIEGGHMIFPITDGRKSVDCTIYEPAKSFRFVAEKLRPGDIVTVIGAVRDEPRTVNVEKLHVETLVEHMVKTANPMCVKCGKRMKSCGKDQGYRCAKCGARSDKAEYAAENRDLKTGWYEPPVGARRHLSKPLTRQFPD
jgi:tRNA(Ile2)-agmatinylcytidine synthase